MIHVQQVSDWQARELREVVAVVRLSGPGLRAQSQKLAAVTGVVVVLMAAATLAIVAILRSPPAPATVAFIGDSYTAGSPEDDGYASRFPSLVGRSLGVRADVLAEPGAGYVTPGVVGVRFLDEVEALEPDTDVVVVWGSRNDPFDGDDAQAIGQAAGALFDAIERRAPQATVLVVGPTFVESPTPQGGKANSEAIARVAALRGISFTDALDWLQSPPPGVIGRDGVHPSAEGHALIARNMTKLVSNALASR